MHQRDGYLNGFATAANVKKFSVIQSGKYVVHKFNFINKVKSEV